MPYLKKHKRNPVTGENLAVKDLIKLTFHKNTDGQYICPITYKGNCSSLARVTLNVICLAFSDHTRIVFIKTSGQVYSMEAIDQLNIKTNNWTVRCIVSLVD